MKQHRRYFIGTINNNNMTTIEQDIETAEGELSSVYACADNKIQPGEQAAIGISYALVAIAKSLNMLVEAVRKEEARMEGKGEPK